ncbi:glutamate ABC transporter substrate-binding protein [Microbacterium esteraromaticum]|uniref:glutamate ABC transporter substrate-binding protein n=1 Tax=Microbacterium esteraromaticum TaxID=57043 RepID=UPI0019D3C033|nr:glutamate ABC transporter substrate-binding protein [Microbacterium esteraromaticum]MBN7794930.1 glutamate ABC transporter substrate-binding protein [Microbacterium esteraromaticum]
MRRTRTLAGIGIATVALFALTACNSSDTAGGGLDFEVATDVSLDGSPTFDAMVERGGPIIGVKEDQPNLGYLDATTGERSGFDIEIARWIAASLGFEEGDITYEPIASANREQALVNGDIDYYVGTYSITDSRKEQINFAGPYFVTGQGFLVSADSEMTEVNDVSDFNGMTVCSATGSTPIQNIKDNYPEINTQEYDIYSQCVEDLLSGKVDAVTTDAAILIGYAAQNPDELKVLDGLFTEERYGVGVPKGDTVLQEHINTLFTEGGDTWQEIFDATLGQSGIQVDQPAVDPVE